MAGAKRVEDHEVDVGLDEGYVIVAPVPDYYVGFLLSLSQYPLIVYAGVDYEPLLDMWLVLFSLLNGALVLVQVFERGEPLEYFFGKVAVRHRVSNNGYLLPSLTDHCADAS